MSTMGIKKVCLGLAGRLTKKQIRSKILARLKIQKEEDRNRKSKLIKNRLFRTSVFKKAKTVMFYISFNGEVDTQSMIKEAYRLGKRVAVPVCTKRKITIMPCVFRDKMSLKRGPYGVCEPAVKKYIKLRELDLVIVPGVTFDKKGNRLGRGKGCYDHFLKKLPCDTPSIGLEYSFQILPFLPTTTTDVRIGRVISA